MCVCLCAAYCTPPRTPILPHIDNTPHNTLIIPSPLSSHSRRIAVTRDHALQQLVNRMMQKLQVPMLPTLAPGGGGGGTAGGLLQGGALQVGATHAGQGAVGRGTVGPLDEQEEEEEEQGQQRVGGREGNVGMREGGVIGQRTRQGTTRYGQHMWW